MPAHPTTNAASPLTSFRGHHVGIRVSDYEAVRDWHVSTLNSRILQEWTGMDMSWAYLCLPADHGFHLEVMGGVPPGYGVKK